MEKIIKITGFSNKETKDKKGTFPCFEVLIDGEAKSIGVFESEVVDALKKQLDQWVKVVIAKRPNGYLNITHFVAVATEEEVPSTADFIAKPKPERIISNEKAGEPSAQQVVRYIHEVVTDTRKNSMECGKAGERVKIYFDTIESFAKQYEELVIAKRAIDAKLNQDPKE